jgi:hypothetical protein
VRRYRVDRDKAIWEQVDGQVVVIHARTSYYYALNRTGTAVWHELTARACTLDDLARRLGRAYGRPPGDVRGDVERLLAQLQREDLVVVEEDAGEEGEHGRQRGPEAAHRRAAGRRPDAGRARTR